MPDPIPLPPRRDDTAADTGSLVRLGRQDPPPVPKPSTRPFLEPRYSGGGDWTDGTDTA